MQQNYFEYFNILGGFPVPAHFGKIWAGTKKILLNGPPTLVFNVLNVSMTKASPNASTYILRLRPGRKCIIYENEPELNNLNI